MRSFSRSHTAVTSFEQWGFPVDLEAGPGSHDLPELMGKQSARYSNTPTVSFGKAARKNKCYLSKAHEREALGTESPGPGAFSSTFGTAAPRVAMGTGKARYLECFETLKNRSPGPIYLYGDSRHPGPAFGTGPQRPEPISLSPAPSRYSPNKPCQLLSCSLRGKPSRRLYARNLETFMKGQDSPGPMYFPDMRPLGRRSQFPAVGHDIASRSGTPGPGAYEVPAFRRRSGKHGSFGRSIRVFDPRRGARSYETVKFVH